VPENLAYRKHDTGKVVVMDGVRGVLRFQAVRAAHLVLGTVLAGFTRAHVVSGIELNPG
jgi:hypothetical protein